MRFVHSLVKTQKGAKTGWVAPIELGEATPQYVSFVIPINGETDDRYTCEATRINGEERIHEAYELIKEGKDSFFLRVDDEEVWFTIRPASKKIGHLPYIGKLKHADFTSLFTELEAEDSVKLDELFRDKGVILIGCDPFIRYSGIDKLVQKQA